MSQIQEPIPALTAEFSFRAFPNPAPIDPDLSGKDKKDAEIAHGAASAESSRRRTAFVKDHGKKIEAMGKRLAPPKAGKYLVTPPPQGGKNKFVGEFNVGDGPREVDLSAAAAAELGGPHHPFTLEVVRPPDSQE